ncbi:hypothetical protein ACHAXR_012963 [Thalassiosira sp. AJA248-18]
MLSFRHRAFQASQANSAPIAMIGKRPRPMMMGALPSQRQLYCHSWAKRIGSCASRNFPVVTSARLHCAPNKIRTCQIGLLQRQRRNHSSDSSNPSKQPKNVNSGTKSSSKSDSVSKSSALQLPSANGTATKQPTKRRRRSSSNYSPIAQITNNHPKNSTTPPSKQRILTRKQILRLAPKQRTNLHNQRLAEYKDSRSHLDQVRTNVRSNLKYLTDTADSNFKKNVQTMKRLFNGEEVWNDVEKHPSKQQQDSLAKGIDWERAPSEIKAEVKSNLSKAQNWLHKVTDGMIPSSSYVGINAAGEGGGQGGSVATRVQQFHEMKQSTTLVMDNKWIAKNIAIALMPGFLLHLYFLSVEDDMRTYHENLERIEREKILGPVATDKAGGGDVGANENASSNSESGRGGMSISSAFITEGGSMWDKMKMTVNDVFLGGAEERIRAHKENQKQEGKERTSNQVTGSADTSSNHGTKISDSDRDDDDVKTKASDIDDVETKALVIKEDATVQKLLERIQALEKQIGTSDSDSSEEELRLKQEKQRQKEHDLNYKMQRLQQSPIRNRRDDMLARKWSNESSGVEEGKGDIGEINRDVSSKPSYSITDVANFAMLVVEPYLDSTKALAVQKMKEIMSAFGFSEEGKPTVNEQGKGEEKTSHSAAAAAAADNRSTTGATLNSNSLPIESLKENTVPQVKSVEIADSNNVQITDAVETIQDGAKRNSVRGWTISLWQRIRNPNGVSGTNDKGAADQIDKKE